MESRELVEFLPMIALAIALAACTGLRAWLPLFLTSVLARAGLIDLGSSFEFLASNRALVVFGVATLLEGIGDKIPAVDHALDAVGTILRPLAGSLLAASVLWRVEDPLTAILIGVAVGAPASIVPHAAKSGLRALSTTFTAGLANPLISVLEDVITLGLFALAVLVPLLVVALVAALCVFLLRRLRARQGATLRHA